MWFPFGQFPVKRLHNRSVAGYVAEALVGVDKRVKDALEVTRVLQFFSLYSSIAEAESAGSR